MPSRDIQQAKAAYAKRDVELSRLAHLHHRPEQHHQLQGRYLKSIVYGGLDGIITTFAVVAGVAGAALSAGIVLVLGLANLIADGLSMAIGDYLSTKAENEYNKAERNREAWEVDNYPEGEKEELIQLYTSKGLSRPDAQTIVDILAKNKEAWVDVMMVEELGIVESNESPAKNGLATFLSFAAFGSVPLIAFVLSKFVGSIRPVAFPLACVLTASTLFALGSLKVKITERNWLLSGLETLLVGGLAALAAYLVGVMLAGLA